MLHHERVWARATSGGPQPQRVPLLTGDRPHVVPSAVGSRAHVVWGEGASSGRLPSTALRRLVLGLGHVARADLLAREPAARHASHAGGRARLVDKLHVDEAWRASKRRWNRLRWVGIGPPPQPLVGHSHGEGSSLGPRG